MELVIDVTETDLELGCRGDPHRCPIVLAIKRALDRVRLDYGEVCVGGWGIAILNATLTQSVARFRTPVAALDFIIAFDGWRPVQPFVFKLKSEDELDS